MEITKEVLEEFVSKKEIELCSTHAKLCVPIIDRIYRKMSVGIEFSEIKVDGNQICDGHHRYIASLLANVEIGQANGCSTSATDITDWKSVDFVEDDWDTQAKIEMWNQQDAKFNSMSLEELAAKLKLV